ncbi:MAG TPA: bifunctional metallophosphatase/5'-nucleotidase, partial [Actinomyces sp.]|nr:bifunctional metallophosphatase/5'-nucleotidase [Actinomyces sp.]
MKKIAPVAALPLVFGLLAAPAAYAAPSEVTDIDDLTLLATTDLHGTLVDYDYFTGQPFGANKPEDARGLDRLSTAIKGVRADKGEESVILLDNGDANQGASIETVYHANRTADTIDPMASAFNYLNYDAVVAGNHEFNYGLEDLSQYIGSLDMPFLAANVDDRETGNFAYDPYTIIEKTTADGHTVNVGVVGVVTPGVPGWDGDKVASLEFNDTVETLKQVVPLVKADGADVVIVLAHTGEDPTDYVWNPADLQENAARSIAQNVSGIDVIV